MDSHRIVVDGASLHVGVTGEGSDVVMLSGGPGCVQYLESDALAPQGFRTWFPEPRGVGRSSGGPHDMETAIADLEAIREAAGVHDWIVAGHSWGSDLAVRYALDHPASVVAVIGIAGRGLQRDRLWSEQYHAAEGSTDDLRVEIAWVPEVHAALSASFTEWIHSPELWRSLGDSATPMQFVAAGRDIRPPWPLQQLAELAPRGSFATVPGVPHDFWHSHPDVWRATLTEAARRASKDAQTRHTTRGAARW